MLVLPWVATAALGLGSADHDRRLQGTWRTAVGTGLLASFVPLVLLVNWILLAGHRALGRQRLSWQQLVILALFPPILLLPWLVDIARTPAAALVEAGRAASLPVRPDVWHLIAGNSGGPGAAPFWMTLGVALAGLVALLRADTRTRVLRCWMVAMVA